MKISDGIWVNELEKEIANIKTFDKDGAAIIVAIQKLISIVKKLQQEVLKLKVELNKKN